MNQPLILPYNGIMPRIDPTAFIAPGAVVIGDVVIGPESSVWFGCVVRGDMNVIRIGSRTNIQDGSVIHVSIEGKGTHIGDNVTVGHMALLHECTIESDSFIGMKTTLMDGSKVESRAMLAAGALLTPGKVVASGQIWAGSPAKYLRDLSPEDIAGFTTRRDQYLDLAKAYRQNEVPDTPPQKKREAKDARSRGK